MVILLDTCALSEVQSPKPHSAVLEYLSGFRADEMFVSVVSIGEIWYGIELLPEGNRRRTLERWAYDFERRYEPRILPVDADVARTWGAIGAACRRNGRPLAPADGLIAATAIHHDMRIVTRNVKDFEPTGVLIVNPWENASELP